MDGSGQINRLQKGMTLLEALISLVLLLSAVIGLAAAYQHRIYQSTAARNQAVASMVAQSIASEMQATDPDTWNISELTKTFRFDFQGRMIDGDTEPYFTAEIKSQRVNNFYDVEIGVTWLGWKAERENIGDIDNIAFAYTMNLTIAPNYGDTADP